MNNIFFNAETTDAPPIISDTGARIIRKGKIFELGQWKDRGFSLTAEEAKAAIAAFRPCAVNLEHRPTLLDNHLGELVGIELHGNEIIGTIREPRWLSALLPNVARKVSCEWDRASKKLLGIALTTNPQLPDAAVFAAFSAAQSEGADQPSAIVKWDDAARRLEVAQADHNERMIDATAELSRQIAAQIIERRNREAGGR